MGADNLDSCTRSWFGWANALLVTLVEAGMGADCTAAAERVRLAAILVRPAGVFIWLGGVPAVCYCAAHAGILVESPMGRPPPSHSAPRCLGLPCLSTITAPPSPNTAGAREGGHEHAAQERVP